MNFIDDYLFAKIERDQIPHAGLCTDEEFMRRVSLDLTGRIPSAVAVRSFLSHPDPDKRSRLVESLIGTPEFVDRWTLWFNDFLKNTIYPVSVQGRNALHNYIKDFVGANRPYNQVVQELITAEGDNFSVGPLNYLIKAGGADANVTPDIYDDLAVATAKNFLGLRLLCISCHSGAGYLDRTDLGLSRKRRQDFWGQAAFFAPMKIEAQELADLMSYRFQVSDTGPRSYDSRLFEWEQEFSFRPPRRTDGPIKPRYILNGYEPNPGENIRHALARMITSDIQFAKATVNYLWTHFMGIGIVDPPDGFDLARQDPNNPPSGDDATTRWWRENAPLQPSHPELLEALAREFVASRYDLRHIMSLICTSTAYQLSSNFPAPWRPEYVRYFARKLPRLLTAEEIHDAVVMATGVKASYSIYGSSQKVAWAMQLPGPEEPAPAHSYDLESFAALDFLDSFGRPDRFRKEREFNKLTLFQPLALMHSFFIAERVAAESDGRLKRLLESPLTDAQLVDELFLSTLSRQPSPEERKLAILKLQVHRRDGAEDLLWSLINKLDFIFAQ
jgi:hypothetical protein